MKTLLRSISNFFEKPLNVKSRLLVVLAALLIIPTFFLPIWNLEFWSTQYPEGLDLYIYSYKLDAGDDGNDLTEINILNHYIGMKALEDKDFSEFKWMPLAFLIFIFISLRAAVFGKMSKLVDAFFLFLYFGAYSIWAFWYRLYSYGHNLDPRAAVDLEPFMPPVFGYKPVGQFKVWSYPDTGTYFLLAFVLLIVVAAWLSRKESIGANQSL